MDVRVSAGYAHGVRMPCKWDTDGARIREIVCKWEADVTLCSMSRDWGNAIAVNVVYYGV